MCLELLAAICRQEGRPYLPENGAHTMEEELRSEKKLSPDESA